MNSRSISYWRSLPALAAAALFFLLACHLTSEQGTVETFTFPNLAVTLQGSDTALIVLKDGDGKFTDTLYHGPVNDNAFRDLVSKNYKGGRAVITIEGVKDGEVVYKVEKTYSGVSGFVDGSVVVISKPSAKADSVSISPENPSLRVRGPELALSAKVFPESLNQQVTWKSLETGIATISALGSVSGRDSGSARMVATSVADPRRSDTVLVAVLPPIRVESVAFDRALLDLYVDGASETVVASVLPVGANPLVTLSVDNSTFVELKDGKARGLKEGETRITAKSLEDTTKSAFLRVVVHPKPAAPVESVGVSPDTLKLYTGGADSQLTATIYPTSHEPRFAWHSAAGSIATVDATGKVSPVAVGRVFVRARSLVDSTKGDSTLVFVIKDTPRIDVGGDTTVSVGSTLQFNPKVSQAYGSIVEVRWDLNDSASWDETANAFRPVSQAYPVAREYNVRFYAKDSEGNDTTVIKKVKVVNGPVILFKSPADGFQTNQNPITVVWTVDNVEQTSQEPLKAGPNPIKRSAKNAAGEEFSATIIVHYDTVAPTKPLVKGPASPVGTLRPEWRWESMGGGNGTFRFRLDVDNMTTGATLTTDTAYTPAVNLTGGSHILYVQERDAAGNWSTSGSFAVRIDSTPPPAPTVTNGTPSPTNNRRPTWNWTGTASEGTSAYRYKLDNDDFRTGTTATSLTTFTAGTDLPEGPHILYVQQADSAGNWSLSGHYTIRIDLSAPSAPKVNAPASPTNDRTPSFTFTPQGGGNGTYRVKFNDRNLNVGAIEVSTPGYTPADSLAPGKWVLHVQERDTAGNWSASDSGTVTIDLTVPASPTVNAPDGTPTIDRTPRWSWKQAAGGTGAFRYKFNDANLNTGATETTDTLYVHPTDLNEGTYTLYVQQRNSAGTWSGNGFKAIRVDLTKPAQPVVTPVQSSPTTERRPTWNWNHSEPGVGFYRYSLDGGAFRDTNSTSFRAGSDLSHGVHTLRIMERDSAGNWSDAGSADITLDIQGPNAPTMNMTQPRSPVGTLRPTWRWTSGGNGGSGQFRYKLDNGAYSAWGSATQFQPPTQTEGEHTVYVQERDALGNESAEASRKIILVNRGLIGNNSFSMQANSVSAAANSSGILHAAVSEASTASVYYYSNNSWSVLGNTPFASPGYGPKIAFSKDTAFVAYTEPDGDNYAIKVKKFVQGSWQPVGNAVASASFYYAMNMAIGPNGTPYVTWISGNDFNVTVARLNRSQNKWESAGSTVGLSTDDGGYTTIAITSANEVYVGYTDWSSGSSGHPTIKRLDGTSWTQVLRYPNGGSYLTLAFHGNIPYFTFSSGIDVKLIRYTSAWAPQDEYTIAGKDNTVTADESTLGISSDGIPYIAYKTFSQTDNVYVVTPVDGNLAQVGPPAGSAHSGTGGLNVVISPSGIPQVILIDKNFSETASGYKFGFEP